MFNNTMQQESKLDCDSERIWKIVEKYTPKDKAQKRAESQNLFDNLYNSYISHSQVCSDKRFRSTSNLLQKLPPENAKVTFIISLYSDEEGYSLMLCPNTGNGEQQEIFLPYENDDIFSYLDAGEIPPVVLEILGKTQFCHMYSGCVICEVRNYRGPHLLQREGLPMYDSNLVLLKPTAETHLALVNELTNKTGCSREEKLQIESKILMATQPPLCLEPETDVVCVQNRLFYNRKKFHSDAMRRYLRRQCHARRAIMHLYSEGPHPELLSLREFLTQQRQKRDNATKSTHSVNVLQHRRSINMPSDVEKIVLEVKKFAKSVQSDVITLLSGRTEVLTPPPPLLTPQTSLERSPMKVADEFLNQRPEQGPKPAVSPIVTSTPSPPVTRPTSLTPPKPHFVPLSHPLTSQAAPFQPKPPVTSLPTTTATHEAILHHFKIQPQTTRPRLPMDGGTHRRSVFVQPMGTPRLPTFKVLVGNRNIPPKLHPSNPSAPGAVIATSQPASMPKLKPIELHKQPATSLSVTPLPGVPPLKQSNPQPLKQVMTKPLMTPPMPQLHKLQMPVTTSPSSTSATLTETTSTTSGSKL